MNNFYLGDFLIKIKNAAMAKNKVVEFRTTKLCVSVAKALKKEGYLDEVKEGKSLSKVTLTFRDKKPVLMNLKLVSKPGLRVYADMWTLEKKKGPSIYLISTPKGIVSSKFALKNRIGGEVLVEVW